MQKNKHIKITTDKVMYTITFDYSYNKIYHFKENNKIVKRIKVLPITLFKLHTNKYLNNILINYAKHSTLNSFLIL